MRLKNQKIGPVTLRSIDYAPNMSQETAAFTAKVKIAGVGEVTVRNDGCGGPTYIPVGPGQKEVSDALERYCESLPEYVLEVHGTQPMSVKMNTDLFVSLLLERAINQKYGMPSACDGCGDTDHFKLNQRTDLPGVMRKGKLWAPCLCNSCNKNSAMKSSA